MSYRNNFYSVIPDNFLFSSFYIYIYKILKHIVAFISCQDLSKILLSLHYIIKHAPSNSVYGP